MSAPGLDWRVTWSRTRNHEGVARGVRAFVALLCVLLLGWWAGWEHSFMPAMLGVIASALAESDDGWRGRLRAQGLTLAAFAAVGLAVQASQPLPLLQAGVLAAAALVLTLIGALGERYRAVALAALVFAIYIAMLAHQGRSDRALALLLLGAAWYGVVSVLWAALLPRATLRHRMSRLYALLGEQLRLKAQLLEPVRDIDLAGRRMALALHNGRVVLALDATKESLLSRLPAADGPRPRWLQLAMRQYFAAQDIHERVNSSHEDYGLLAETLFHSDALYRCQRVLTRLGAQLLKFAEAIAARGSPVHTGSTTRAIEDMQAAIAHLLAGPLAQQPAAQRALGAVQQLGRNLGAMASVLPALEQPLQGTPRDALHDSAPRDLRAAWQRVLGQLHWQSPLLRHGLRLALTLLLGSAIVATTRDPHAYWVLLTIVFVSQPGYADTRRRMVQRAGGTALGLCLGWAAIRLFPGTVLQSALLVVAAGVFLGSRHTHYTRATASVTVLLLLSFHQAGMGDGVIPTRMLDTVVGGALAWLAAGWCCRTGSRANGRSWPNGHCAARPPTWRRSWPRPAPASRTTWPTASSGAAPTAPMRRCPTPMRPCSRNRSTRGRCSKPAAASWCSRTPCSTTCRPWVRTAARWRARARIWPCAAMRQRSARAWSRWPSGCASRRRRRRQRPCPSSHRAHRPSHSWRWPCSCWARCNAKRSGWPDAAGPHSSVKPIFRPTCQCATLPSTTWPRVSVTWNHWMFRTVSWALAMAVCTASSMPVGDEPVSSSVL